MALRGCCSDSMGGALQGTEIIALGCLVWDGFHVDNCDVELQVHSQCMYLIHVAKHNQYCL